MEFERWIRYLVPGYVALAPLMFAIAFLPDKYQTSQTPLLAALVALGPGVGFVFHQVHMLLHEWRYLANSNRPIIKYIMRLHNNNAALKAIAPEALRAWYYFFYDSKTNSKDLCDYISRSWYFIHSFHSISWSFLFGAFFATVPFFLEPNMDAIFVKTWPILVIVYVVGCLFFFLKSWSTKNYIEEFEEFVAHKHREDIDKILTNILEHRVGKSIRQSEVTSTKTAQPVSSADG